MNPLVRDLYKRFLWAAKDYPAGKDAIMTKVKRAFLENSSLDEVGVKKALAYGRYCAREIVAVNQLHKYRTMKKRYPDAAA